MKLILAIVHDEDSSILISEMNKADYRVTKLSSSGGFLHAGNTTLMLAVEDNLLDKAIDIIRKYSHSRKELLNTSIVPPPFGAPSPIGAPNMPYPIEVIIGGATVVVINIDHFEKI